MQAAKLLNHIDRIVFAYPGKPEGEGIALAIERQVNAAPFFIGKYIPTTLAFLKKFYTPKLKYRPF